jgi:hypothetical protein
MTPFAALLKLAGLSHREAGVFLGIREQQCKDMASGRRRTPPGVIVELSGLIRRQEAAATVGLSQIEDGDAETIAIPSPANDAEAAALGWPSVGAWGAMAARIIAGARRPVAFTQMKFYFTPSSKDELCELKLQEETEDEEWGSLNDPLGRP